MANTHASVLHDVYSGPSFYSTWSRPMSPPFDDSLAEETQGPRMDRRSMTFAEFLSSMGSGQHPPPQQRTTDLVRRPTLHRRDYDFLSRQRNRNNRSSRSGQAAPDSQSGEFTDLRGESLGSTPHTFTRRPSSWRHSLGDNGLGGRSHLSSSRHRSFHGTGPSSSTSRLRRGGVQPPELISPSTESESIEPPGAANSGSTSRSEPLVIWDAREEYLTALPTPRSTSPETSEGRRER